MSVFLKIEFDMHLIVSSTLVPTVVNIAMLGVFWIAAKQPFAGKVM